MSSILSQEDIDELLIAVNEYRDEGRMDDFQAEKVVVNPNPRKVRIYDFKRPDRFSRENVRALSIIHETFARLMTTALSSNLLMPLHCHVCSVDQLTYEEFIRSIPTPTNISIINMDPLGGNALFEIDPALTFAIIDRLAGGSGEYCKTQHELTEIEFSLMEGIVVRLLGDLRESWTQIIDLRPRLASIETNPQFCQIVYPSEMCVLISFDCVIGDVEGLMNLCIPCSTLDTIMNKLSIISWYNKIPHGTSTPDLSNIKVPLIAEIFNKNFKLSEIKNFKKNTEFIADSFKLKINNSYFGEFKIKNSKVEITKIYGEKPLMEKENLSYEKGNLNDVKVKVIVELGRKELTIEQLQQCSESTILELDSVAGEPVNIFANNILFAKGEVVAVDENYSVRITEILSKE